MGFFSFLRKRRRRKILKERPIPNGLWAWARKNHPILHRLIPHDLVRLRELATIFLAEKRFVPLGRMVLRDYMPVSIAVMSVLPVLNLGLEWLDGFRTIFLVQREYQDLRREWDGAVMKEYVDEIGGEVTEYGALIFSWKDVEASGWGRGYNVVIHEIAHTLDYTNGAMDGCPHLRPDQDPARWKDVFISAFRDLNKRPAGNPPLDLYAAESAEEFFAVSCEEFFERPKRLFRFYPGVYQELDGFFRQDPLKVTPCRYGSRRPRMKYRPA